MPTPFSIVYDDETGFDPLIKHGQVVGLKIKPPNIEAFSVTLPCNMWKTISDAKNQIHLTGTFHGVIDNVVSRHFRVGHDDGFCYPENEAGW